VRRSSRDAALGLGTASTLVSTADRQNRAQCFYNDLESWASPQVHSEVRVLMSTQNDEIDTVLARVVQNTFASVAKFYEGSRPAKLSGVFGNKLVQRAQQFLFSLCQVASGRRLCGDDVQ